MLSVASMSKYLQLFLHPQEFRSTVELALFREPLHEEDITKKKDSWRKCYFFLNKTSRSFASVIRELHPELRDAVMLFYLILRALDTVEDDMSLGSEVKIPLLRSFHEKLKLRDWSFHGNGEKEKDRILLLEFPYILDQYHTIRPEYQDIIMEITKKMGNGMAQYVLDEEFNVNGINTVKDYDLYCHFVAGLVGEGLTRLMVLAGFSDNCLIQDNFAKSESMGLFLQKTNIIRDYQEDLQEGRSFWPKEVWMKYTSSLPSFYKDSSLESQERGLYCINELVLNSLGHVKDVLTYLSLVRDPSCFNFCAIPQVMAIATLATVYNNPKVLNQVVKIRKGTTFDLIARARTLPGVVKIFKECVRLINHKSTVKDPNYQKIGIKCGEIEQFCEIMYPTPNAIPKGAARTKHEINDNILKRGYMDAQVSQAIALEKFKFKALSVGFLLIIGLIYRFLL